MNHTRDLDARTFGAKGDGSADDTAAIQKALDAAGEVGGTVWLPPGAYRCGMLKMHPRTGLFGEPTWNYRAAGGAILHLIDVKAPGLIDITGAFGATINGLCLEGGKLGESVHGVLLNKSDYGKEEDTPRIERCRIARFSGDGVHLLRAWCFSIRSCMIAHNGRDGIRLRGWDGFILDNWLSGNGGAGFGAVEENCSVTMTGNRIEWNAGGGISLRGGSHYNITGNYIDRSGAPGISLLPGADGEECKIISATGNLIYRSGRPADGSTQAAADSCHVRIEQASGIVFSGNTMNAGRDDGAQGVWSPRVAMILRALTNSVIKDNVMHNGALGELLRDLGGHGEGVVIKDNVGCLSSAR